jgi:putative FmdB family regulatory protein
MPLFSYACGKCKMQSEVLVRSSSEQPVCPKCGSDDMSKQMSAITPVGASKRRVAGSPICDDSACARCPGAGACQMN